MPTETDHVPNHTDTRKSPLAKGKTTTDGSKSRRSRLRRSQSDAGKTDSGSSPATKVHDDLDLEYHKNMWKGMQRSGWEYSGSRPSHQVTDQHLVNYMEQQQFHQLPRRHQDELDTELHRKLYLPRRHLDDLDAELHRKMLRDYENQGLFDMHRPMARGVSMGHLCIESPQSPKTEKKHYDDLDIELYRRSRKDLMLYPYEGAVTLPRYKGHSQTHGAYSISANPIFPIPPIKYLVDTEQSSKNDHESLDSVKEKHIPLSHASFLDVQNIPSKFQESLSQERRGNGENSDKGKVKGRNMSHMVEYQEYLKQVDIRQQQLLKQQKEDLKQKQIKLQQQLEEQQHQRKLQEQQQLLQQHKEELYQLQQHKLQQQEEEIQRQQRLYQMQQEELTHLQQEYKQKLEKQQQQLQKQLDEKDKLYMKQQEIVHKIQSGDLQIEQETLKKELIPSKSEVDMQQKLKAEIQQQIQTEIQQQKLTAELQQHIKAELQKTTAKDEPAQEKTFREVAVELTPEQLKIIQQEHREQLLHLEHEQKLYQQWMQQQENHQVPNMYGQPNEYTPLSMHDYELNNPLSRYEFDLMRHDPILPQSPAKQTVIPGHQLSAIPLSMHGSGLSVPMHAVSKSAQLSQDVSYDPSHRYISIHRPVKEDRSGDRLHISDRVTTERLRQSQWLKLQHERTGIPTEVLEQHIPPPPVPPLPTHIPPPTHISPQHIPPAHTYISPHEIILQKVTRGNPDYVPISIPRQPGREITIVENMVKYNDTANAVHHDLISYNNGSSVPRPHIISEYDYSSSAVKHKAMEYEHASKHKVTDYEQQPCREVEDPVHFVEKVQQKQQRSQSKTRDYLDMKEVIEQEIINPEVAERPRKPVHRRENRDYIEVEYYEPRDASLVYNDVENCYEEDRVHQQTQRQKMEGYDSKSGSKDAKVKHKEGKSKEKSKSHSKEKRGSMDDRSCDSGAGGHSSKSQNCDDHRRNSSDKMKVTDQAYGDKGVVECSDQRQGDKADPRRELYRGELTPDTRTTNQDTDTYHPTDVYPSKDKATSDKVKGQRSRSVSKDRSNGVSGKKKGEQHRSRRGSNTGPEDGNKSVCKSEPDILYADHDEPVKSSKQTRRGNGDYVDNQDGGHGRNGSRDRSSQHDHHITAPTDTSTSRHSRSRSRIRNPIHDLPPTSDPTLQLAAPPKHGTSRQSAHDNHSHHGNTLV